MTAPCYLCGKPSVLESLCADCYNTNHPLIEVTTPLTLLACKKCGSIKLSYGWRKIATDPIDIAEVSDYQIELLLESAVKILGKDVTISLDEEKRLDRVSHTLVTVSGKSHESLPFHEERYPIEIRFRYSTCETCSMMSGGYYEAILQLRADNRELTDSEKTEITKIVENTTIARYKSDEKAFITNTIENKNGVDFYIGSENLCKALADELEMQYLAERKENYKLSGEDKTGRRKYRITILIRLPHFTIGDFVNIENEACLILAMSRNMLTCFNLKHRERFSLSPKNARWRTMEFVAPASSRREFMITTHVYGKPVQLMDSKSFRVIDVEADLFDSDIVIGKKVYVFEHEDSIYLLPDQNETMELI